MLTGSGDETKIRREKKEGKWSIEIECREREKKEQKDEQSKCYSSHETNRKARPGGEGQNTNRAETDSYKRKNRMKGRWRSPQRKGQIPMKLQVDTDAAA
jgi:hypothetical protein